jgi:DNA-binding MarR family transcriptional regulator
VPERVLYGAIVHELGLATRLAREITAGRLRAGGVDPEEYGLVSIVGTMQPVTRTALAKATGLRRTTLRDALRTVIDRGHVVEEPHPKDRRATLLTLTPAGQDVFDRGMPVFLQFLVALDRELDGKIDEFEQAVWTVRVALERMAAG